MKFRVLFICSMVSNVLSGIVGIAIAYLGFGVWALVIQQLAQQLILTVSLFIAVKMKVKFKIYKESAKELVPFSIKVLTSSLLSFLSGSICNLVVGKTHSMTDLGYYEKELCFLKIYLCILLVLYRMFFFRCSLLFKMIAND